MGIEGAAEFPLVSFELTEHEYSQLREMPGNSTPDMQARYIIRDHLHKLKMKELRRERREIQRAARP